MEVMDYRMATLLVNQHLKKHIEFNANDLIFFPIKVDSKGGKKY